MGRHRVSRDRPASLPVRVNVLMVRAQPHLISPVNLRLFLLGLGAHLRDHPSAQVFLRFRAQSSCMFCSHAYGLHHPQPMCQPYSASSSMQESGAESGVWRGKVVARRMRIS